MRIELTEKQEEEIFDEVLSTKKFSEIGEEFDAGDIIQFLKINGIDLIEPKFDQAINSYALEALQNALNRGVDPFKIQETLDNLK